MNEEGTVRRSGVQHRGVAEQRRAAQAAAYYYVVADGHFETYFTTDPFGTILDHYVPIRGQSLVLLVRVYPNYDT